MNPDLRVLNLSHFGTTQEEDLQITLSPALIKMITAKDISVQNRLMKETMVLFLDDSDPVVLNLSPLDLITLQQAVGTYGFIHE